MLALIRTIVLIAAFQVSGAVNGATEFLEVVGVGHHAEATANDEDDPNHECPPGCPSCHHVHYSGASLPPGIAVAVASVALNEALPAEWQPRDEVPPEPPLPGLYRPPEA